LKVSIVIGSKTDLDLAKASAEVLDSFEIKNTINVLSAHRMPEILQEHINEALNSGTKIFIGIAGMAAHLAGNIAAHTSVPVIGVPGDGGPLNGFDALLSTVQMPKGVPVATVAIGKAGAINAGHLAAQMLAIGDENLSESIKDARIKQKQQLKKENDELQAG
jgi:5-(carboxyamino)imidazole ribonucleotide mutase|tara:strand:+ start:5359 stop:5847 length:489 start_codon:yes stop_codon:yes gene_type:complete